MSKFFYVNMTEQLKTLGVGDSLIIRIKPYEKFSKAQACISACAVRVKIHVSQESLKGCFTNFDSLESINLIQVTRV